MPNFHLYNPERILIRRIASTEIGGFPNPWGNMTLSDLPRVQQSQLVIIYAQWSAEVTWTGQANPVNVVARLDIEFDDLQWVVSGTGTANFFTLGDSGRWEGWLPLPQIPPDPKNFVRVNGYARDNPPLAVDFASAVYTLEGSVILYDNQAA